MDKYIRIVKEFERYCNNKGYSLQYYNTEEYWAVAMDRKDYVVHLRMNPYSYRVFGVREFVGENPRL